MKNEKCEMRYGKSSGLLRELLVVRKNGQAGMPVLL
jgi:hypothetical protein